MDESSFGARLRRQRVERGASLEAVSAATRISIRILEAFENGQWNRLPGGIFNRGFLRSIARYLKIDEEALIADYVAATNDSPERRAQAAKPASRSLHVVWISVVALLLAAAIAAGGYFAFHRARSRSPRPVSRTAPNSATMDPLHH
ncbi:MAG: helix-turn-helix domain-containing protein [Acidobacteriota bacterium]|nr:helix-turn-helix domain-containing protein [Acidobacteriota bacterium]